MLVYAFDFTPIKEMIKKVMKEDKGVPFGLTVIITAKAPTIDSDLIQRFYEEGKLKSYQKKEIIVKIKELIKNAFNNNLEGSLNRFSRIKHCTKVKIKNDFYEFKISVHIQNISRFSSKSLFAIISHFNVDMLGYCDEVEATVSTKSTIGSPLKIIFSDNLEKESVVKLRKFVSLDDKETILELFRCPEVKDILFHHFFPHGLENDRMRTEITIDTLREDTIAQKRRKVLLPSGEYVNFHDAITPYLSHEEFVEIIDINDILGFYPCVRTTKTHEIVTAMIDIDVSRFLRTTFPPSLVWKLVINLTEEIISNLTDFLRLPPPLVIFSGSKGVHLTYRLAPDCVNADFKYVDYSELYLLPSQKSLAKDTRSLIHNKFSFIKSLMQAVLLYTAQNLSREIIPKEIREALGIVNIMDFFTLSVFSRNKIGVLLDTSSNNSSVHRVFSIHPTTGLLSIPILDPKTKKISLELKKFSNLKEAANPETITKNLKEGNKGLYYQFPPEIDKNHIKYLLRPDTLLPFLSVIVRFSDRWATERSPWSMKFWIEMYQLNNFYDYLISKMVSIEKSDKTIGTSYQEIAKLIDNSNIKTKEHVKEVVNDYFFRSIGFKTLKTRLDAFHDLDFHASFKFTEITSISPERINELYSNIRERNSFFRKFLSYFNITIVLLSHFSKNSSKITTDTKQSLALLHERSGLLKEEVKLIKLAKKDDKKLILKRNFVQLACLFNIISNFIREAVMTLRA